MLAGHCQDGLSVFAGEARRNEAVGPGARLLHANRAHAHNRHFFGGALYLCWQQGLLAWLEDWQPDALIAEANPRYLSTPTAVQWMKSRNRPVIGWGLGAPPIRGPLAGLRQARRRAFLKQFDAVIAYSGRGAQDYAALGFPAGRIYLAPNAVSPRPAGNPPKRPASFQGQPTVIYVGRLQARKRLDSLIRALAGLPNPLQARLQIVGEGSTRADLEQLAKQIYPETEFHGAQYGTALDRLFDKADLFVLPGSGGLAVQQAMAHALPVIVAEGDGTQADLVSPRNGWLLPPGDEAALGRALKEALSDASGLRRLGAESYRLVKEKFNLETMVEVFVQALNEVKP
jgi:glycosyltransferase involved in cell wall biosynthesis